MRSASINIQAQPSPLVCGSEHAIVLPPLIPITDESGLNITDESGTPIVTD